MADIRTFNRVLDGEHVISEAQGRRSRESIILMASAAPYPPGTVLGKVTATGHYGVHDPAAVDGREAAAGVLFLGKPAAAASTQKAVAHVRDCELNVNKVAWIDGISAPNKAAAIADLAAAGCLLRA